ncbi:MAG: TolC family outer membrane protein [Pseudomonadota bacterium]
MGTLGRSVRAAALAATTVVALTAPAGAETITETLSDTYRNSGLIDRNRAVLRAADEDVAQALSALRPQIGYAVDALYREGAVLQEGLTASLTLSLDLTLYDFGRNALAVETQKELVLATRQALLRVEGEALALAVTAFFDVREAFETVALRESNVRLITQELRAAEDRFDVGEVTRTDVAIAQSRLAAARASLATAQGDLSIAVASFRQSVGRAPGNLRQPTRLPAIPRSVAEAKAIARRASPEILQVRHEITAAELGLERAKRALRPTLSGSAQTSFDLGEGQDLARSSNFGLRLSGPISQGGRLNSIIRQAQASVDQSRADLLLATLATDQAVDNAYAQLAVARASLVASDEQIRAATVAFRGVREEATLGARTTLDVLDAEQELLDARAARVTAAASEFRAVYGILQATGQLTAQALALPVQLYDPAGYYDLVRNAPQYLPNSEAGARLDRVLESLGKN